MKKTILYLINNIEGWYDGDLKYYFKLIFNAPNINNPYHNFRHLLHVAWEAHDAIGFYHTHSPGDISKRNARAILIAALFHDYGHKGVMGNDHENIATAIDVIRNNILNEDKDLLIDIERLISATEYPLIDCELTLDVQIIRDADMSQSFGDTWLQQIVFGLAKEYKMSAVDFLKQQLIFIPNVSFNTQWGKDKFDSQKNERVVEVKSILELLA